MQDLFLIITVLSFVAIFIFAILAVVQIAKKDNAKLKKQIKYAGIAGALMIVSFIGFGMTSDASDTTKNNEEKEETVTKPKEETSEEKDATVKKVEITPKQILLNEIKSLLDEKLAFDSGDYIQGDIPAGDYAFIRFDGSGQYYSEENQNGDIIDNENFDSFGYVYVHGVGNISNTGLLINVSAFEKLKVSGAKEIFELINDKNDYNDAGYYKVGVDIPAGSYVLESYGEGYGAVMTGPIGNSDIVTNNNFNGRYQVNVIDGQYLTFSRAIIKQQ